MKKHLNIIALILTGLILFGCLATKATSIIYNDSYDKQGNFTSVTISPYGVVKVPGKWVKIRESTISGQYFFVNEDSVKIAVALYPWDKYEFSYKNPQITRQNFVKKFYEWDSNYLREKTNGQIRVVKEDKGKDYLIWNLSSGLESQEYFLFGLKGETAYNLYVKTNKWDEDTKVKFLEKLYID